jgi:intracellular septation protein A
MDTLQSMAGLLALVLTAVALAPSAAQVIGLPNKLHMEREEYLVVQRVYRSWPFLGILVVAALAATLWFASIMHGPAEAPAVIAFLAVLATQVVFWIFTFPVKRLVGKGRGLPEEDWERLRDRWEISHAVNALLNFVALVCVAVAILKS